MVAVRGAARALVVNDWLRKRYRPRRHQKVLQTWHGTMLKRLALDRERRHPHPHCRATRTRPVGRSPRAEPVLGEDLQLGVRDA